MSTPSTPRISADPTNNIPSPSLGRSGYPFPSPSSTNRYRPRRGSSSSVISVGSIGGSLDIPHPRENTVRESGQNAIATLLQPPIVRTGLLPHTQASLAGTAYKAPTTKDITPVTLTNIPHVPAETFRDYLSQIGPLFENFRRGRSESEQSQWLQKGKKDKFEEALERRLSDLASSTRATLSPTSARSPGEAPTSRRRSSGGLRRNRNEPTPLSTIPNVYFDEDFHLENPRTFDVVSERAEIIRQPLGSPAIEQTGTNGAPLPPRTALVTNAILQEKLSWYMDTVEVHLVNSISAASSGFFAALGSLKELQTEAEQCIAKIQGLRDDLKRLDEEVAMGGLEVAASRRRRANVHKLSRTIAQVQTVVENVTNADELVDEGKFEEATDQMEKIGILVRGGRDGVDLRSLKALQGLEIGLKELQFRIGTGFASRFITALINDLRQHIEKVSHTDTLKRWSRQRGIPPTYMETSEELRTELLASLKGLQKAGQTAPATAAYREAVNKEVKSLIRKYLPSSNEDDIDSMISTSTRGGTKLSQQEKSTILARNLRALDAEDAEKLIVNVYTTISEALRRVSTQTKVLLDVTSNVQAPEARSPPRSPVGGEPSEFPSLSETMSGNAQEELSQTLDMSSLLGQTVDTAQDQIGRILRVRNEQTTHLPTDRFLRYFTLNRLFADECEAISGRGGQALRGTINAQISGFVQALGTAETERIANLLDNDGWNAVDFSDQNEVLLQRVLASMGSDPPEWTNTAKPIWEDLGEDAGERQTNGTDAEAAVTNGKTQTKPAQIDETRYVLVSSAASLLTSIDKFLALTASMPSITPTISNTLLEVLRTFNSRSCQLILGAGATRSAGFKNITTKHLALASQALSFVIALIPYTRECVRRHLPSGQIHILAEFDKTKRLYQDHQTGIHDKLVEIMTSRSQAHIKAMKAISFDDPVSDDSKASPYIETLTKETLTLHRVLSRNLSEIDVSLIMRQIFTSYREQWIKAFGEIEVTTEDGEKRLLRDAEIFSTRLGKIEGFGDMGEEVVKIVNAKSSAEASTKKGVTQERDQAETSK